MWLVLPAVVLARLFGGSRVVWSKSMEKNDLPLTNKDEELNDLSPELQAAFAGQRDERLVAALCRLHEERGHEEIEVAVVYGAGHTAAVVAGLQNRYSYRPRSADWLTIADL
jgi:pheromone shutdown protein TraB